MKFGKILLIVSVVALMSMMVSNAFAQHCGCTPGFWKNNAIKWEASWWTVVPPTMTLEEAGFITNEVSLDLTLLEGLQLKGGPGTAGAEEILIRHAVAAVLNAASNYINYPISPADVINAVNAAIGSGERDIMLALADVLDGFNNLGCNLSMSGGPGVAT